MPMPQLNLRVATLMVFGSLAVIAAGPAARAAEGDPEASVAPVAAQAGDVARPGNGMTMSAVEARFGTPANRHEAVGEPPISRWDYAAFAVFFERDRVLHAVLARPTE